MAVDKAIDASMSSRGRKRAQQTYAESEGYEEEEEEEEVIEEKPKKQGRAKKVKAEERDEATIATETPKKKGGRKKADREGWRRSREEDQEANAQEVEVSERRTAN